MSILESLWPEDIRTEVLLPVTILQAQAESLTKVTKGILAGSTEVESAKDKTVLRLVVTAPAYNDFRVTLLTIEHHPKLPYPCLITNDKATANDFAAQDINAADDESLQSCIRKILHSNGVRGVITSLLANSKQLVPLN